ncbi:hypothetical protein SUGI_1131540 [Cryptomeria japonica]|nr:hypothetical protein SUGI_1131540 [Cryptomeria japonica]
MALEHFGRHVLMWEPWEVNSFVVALFLGGKNIRRELMRVGVSGRKCLGCLEILGGVGKDWELGREDKFIIFLGKL